MSATLAHRGPDSDGSFVDGGVGLAARRLAIIDLEGGDQPLGNEDGTCTVVPNGELDPDAVEAFLAFNSIPAPLSIFREIRKLPPGHLLTWTDGELELRRFARPGPLAPREGADEAELVEECRARLRDSVRAHL